MEVSNRIRKDARVKLVNKKINLAPVTGSETSCCGGSVVFSRSREGGCEVFSGNKALICFSESVVGA